MRIAVNTRFLIKDKLEGIGWYTHEVCKRLSINNPNDEFILLFDRKPDPSFVFSSNCTPVVVGPQARHPLLWYWWFEFSLPKILKKYNVDIFLSPDSFTSLSYQGKKALVVHDIGFEHFPEFTPPLVSRYYRHFTPKYCTAADHIFSVSNDGKRDLIDTYGVNSNKVTVAYNGCRKGFRPHTQQEVQNIRDRYSSGQPYFLFVGALHPRKNISRLLQAFDLFCHNHSDYKLLLTGRYAWMAGDIKRTFDNMRHKSKVVFTGYLDHQDLIAVTGAAHACLYPSLFEGFGVPMLEALKSNIPVVASNISCMPEIVGDAGLLIDPFSIPSIAQGMEKVVHDETLRSTMKARGLIQAEHFSWDQTAKTIYSTLKEVAYSKTS